MTYIEAIKGGFKLINQKWQLVLIQAIMMLANCAGFFIIIGIPLGIAFVIFGLDLTGLAETRDIIGLLKNPAELFSKYMGLILMVLASFFLYLIMVTTLAIFIFSGSSGMIGRFTVEPALKFHLNDFFKEGKRLFFPVMWFTIFMGLFFIAIAFILGLFAGGASAIVTNARSHDSTLALFLGIFFSLVLGLFLLLVIIATLAVTVYGIPAIYFKKRGVINTFKDIALFLWRNQDAFWLYVLLFIGYVIVSFVLMMLTYPFNLIPIIGTIISFPLQLLSFIVQSYIGLVILAIVFIYYYNVEIKTEGSSEKPSLESISESSTNPEDTSDSKVPLQEETLPEREKME